MNSISIYKLINITFNFKLKISLQLINASNCVISKLNVSASLNNFQIRQHKYGKNDTRHIVVYYWIFPFENWNSTGHNIGRDTKINWFSNKTLMILYYKYPIHPIFRAYLQNRLSSVFHKKGGWCWCFKNVLIFFLILF